MVVIHLELLRQTAMTANLRDVFPSPLTWSSETFLVVIAVLVVARLLIPWSRHPLARFVEEVCLILPAGLFYFFVRGLQRTDGEIAFSNARDIVALEQQLGLFIEPQIQRAIIDQPTLVNVANWVYIWGHWPVILLWIIWMWSQHGEAYRIYRNAVLLSGIVGMIVFALYPLAPPRLVPELDLVDTVTLRSDAYRVLQPPALTNPFAAMPSLHFGWDLLVGIAIVRHAGHLAGRLIGLLLPIAMFSAIVLTANHYIVDGLVGGGLALSALAIARSQYLSPRWIKEMRRVRFNHHVQNRSLSEPEHM